MLHEMDVSDIDDEYLQKELSWGVSYREIKQGVIKSPLKPQHSPVDVTFNLCRALQKCRKRKKKKNKLCYCSSPIRVQDSPPMSLLDRTALSQNQYMELLSIPNDNGNKCERFKSKKKKRRCKITSCSPRLIQMAVPKKQYVLDNWKAYQHNLPPEILLRFDRILRSGNNDLELKNAHDYFKKIDCKKMKEARKKKKLKRKKLQVKLAKDKCWSKHQISKLTKAIFRHLIAEPLLSINHKQMIISNQLLAYLRFQNIIKSPIQRSTNHTYKTSIIEISDKLVKWIDSLNDFVNIQPLDSKELLEVPSLEDIMEESEETEEGISEIEESSEEEHDLMEWFEGEGIQGMDEQHRLDELMARKLLDKTKTFDDEEGEGSALDFLEQYSEDVLNKLILILSISSPEFLNQDIGDESMSGITYSDVLSKLKEIRDIKTDTMQNKTILEDIMVEWAKNNDPEQVDSKILDKIHETSEILSSLLLTKTPKKHTSADNLQETGGRQDGDQTSVTKDEDATVIDDSGVIVEEELSKDADEAEGQKLVEEAVANVEGTPAVEEQIVKADAYELETESDVKKTSELDEMNDTPLDSNENNEVNEPQAVRDNVNADESTPNQESDNLGKDGDNEAAPETGEFEGAAEIEAKENDEMQPETTEQEMKPESSELTKEAPGQDENDIGKATEESSEKAPESEVDDQTGADETRDGEVIPDQAEDEMKERKSDTAEPESEGKGDELEGKKSELAEGEEIEGAQYDLTEQKDDAEIAEVLGPSETATSKQDMQPSAETAEGMAKLVSEPDKQMPEAVDMTEKGFSMTIKGHKPDIIHEHAPDTICCLSLKVWAIWLLEIAHNAHNWTMWVGDIIKQVRQYASIIRGDVVSPTGQKKVLYKREWRDFVQETEEKIISWRQYSQHVKDLSNEIMEAFHGKKVTCCPKCLQDHMIKNVIVAHDTLQALAEAINCADYWQRCLDRIVEQTVKLTNIGIDNDITSDTASRSDSNYTIELEEIPIYSTQKPQMYPSSPSDMSIYEIEEIDINL